MNPECNYPVVKAVGKEEIITAIYSPNKVVTLDAGKVTYLVNASGITKVFVDASETCGRVELYNTLGEKVGEQEYKSGALILEVPESGYAKLVPTIA